MLDDTDSSTTPTQEDSQGPAPDAPVGAEGETAPEAGAAEGAAKKTTAKKTTAKKTAAKKTTAKKTTAKQTTAKKAAAKKTTAKKAAAQPEDEAGADAASGTDGSAPAEATGSTEATEAAAGAPAPAAKKAPAKKAAAKKAPAKKAAAKKTTAKKTAAAEADTTQAELPLGDDAPADEQAAATTAPPATALTFQPPDPAKATPVRRKKKAEAAPAEGEAEVEEQQEPAGEQKQKPAARAKAAEGPTDEDQDETEDAEETDGESGEGSGQTGGGNRRRRRRGGRRRRKSGSGEDSSGDSSDDDSKAEADEDTQDAGDGGQQQGRSGGDNGGDGGESSGSRRRRRRRRAGEDGDGGEGGDPENTVTRVRKQRNPEDEITALSGSTRLEAKKQRRREGREAGRRRAPIVSEAEFLARREAVDRVMVIRQREDLTQIAVLEDKVLVEHYVARESQTSLIGNVYLGRVQNVLPSMEAAFIDIGKGRNAVLYAGEVNWDALGAGNGPRKIEQVLKSGQPVLVQVTKDPIGHKGARLTSQISLPGRFLVYVPDGTTSGISRKLPDTERNRLKSLLKEIVPDSAGVIVRTAAEGASEEELTLDVERLTARWEDISAKVAKGNAPALLYGEPDLTLKVVRDLFTEDFGKLVVSGDGAWEMVEDYVQHVAPDLSERLERWDEDGDVFGAYRIDEQIAKALDRKVWLPSGGSLIIDRTEAMTVVDVNTGKFTGSGGNLEETVTKNNLEAAEEIVRQLRLRDIGGIIVVDFIDMVLESNRDLVLRRMVECLGRDRTRHQVAEVTSLGLVQMTRKRIGTGLLEAFSESCEHCNGRGLMVHHEPVESRKKVEEEPRRGRRSRGRGRGEDDSRDSGNGGGSGSGNGGAPSPKDVAAMAKPPAPQPAQEKKAEDPEKAVEKAPEKSPEKSPEPAAEKSPDKAPEPAAERAPETPEKAPEKAPERSPGKASEQDAETAPEQSAPPVVGPPRVVTTRRRSARRPAGQPAAASEDGSPVSSPVSSPESSPESSPVSSPAQPTSDGSADEPASAAPVTAPPPPAVVTTSRRRGVARRVSGPPSATDADGDGTSEETPTDADGDGTPEETPADAVADADGTSEETPTDAVAEGDGERRIAVHVPVKNKGSRKR